MSEVIQVPGQREKIVVTEEHLALVKKWQEEEFDAPIKDGNK